MDLLQLKRMAAEYAAGYVESGTVVGLGGGSTALLAIERIAERLHSGALRSILGVPCSTQVEQDARRLGIPLTSLEEHPAIHLAVDGADEVDPQLNLIKGRGGALLREKIIAQTSLREIIVVDETKLSPTLGTNALLPVEVVRFGWRSQLRFLSDLATEVSIRTTDTGDPIQTDQGNFILDCAIAPIADPVRLSRRLGARAGIAGHGLFLGLATDVVVGSREGIRHLKLRSQARRESCDWP